MPTSKQGQVLVACPQCGHSQPESRDAYSTLCRRCGRHFRVQDVLHPAPRLQASAPELKQITCFECGAVLDVPATAESTICKRCSRYVDLKDYHIAGAISKNFKTKGMFVVQSRGFVFNTDSLVGDAVIQGRFLGKLKAERSLTLYSSAEIKGSFTAGLLVLPPANCFRWNDPVQVGAADIGGEWVGHLRASGTVTLKSTARFFGILEASDVVAEEGVVIEGALRIGRTRGGARDAAIS